MTPDLTVIILTYNETIHLKRALDCAQQIAKEIIVIDSFSTDDTVDIARTMGAKVFQHPFVNHARQFQWALDTVPISTEWIMRLDADEVLEPDLIAEIEQNLDELAPDIVGIILKRQHIFLGRKIRFGGRYPLLMLRIWRRGRGQVENRWMDEHILVSGGQTITFNGGFADHNLNDLGFFTQKHNDYATREAIDILSEKYGLQSINHESSLPSEFRNNSMQFRVKLGLYNRLYFPIGPVLYFLYRYIVLMGILDGKEGLIYHTLQGFWYRFLVGAKLFEFEKSIGSVYSTSDIRTKLGLLTGRDLS